jgi:hypothetical protein
MEAKVKLKATSFEPFWSTITLGTQLLKPQRGPAGYPATTVSSDAHPDSRQLLSITVAANSHGWLI